MRTLVIKTKLKERMKLWVGLWVNRPMVNEYDLSL
jgi:hypothetical protein